MFVFVCSFISLNRIEREIFMEENEDKKGKEDKNENKEKTALYF